MVQKGDKGFEEERRIHAFEPIQRIEQYRQLQNFLLEEEPIVAPPQENIQFRFVNGYRANIPEGRQITRSFYYRGHSINYYTRRLAELGYFPSDQAASIFLGNQATMAELDSILDAALYPTITIRNVTNTTRIVSIRMPFIHRFFPSDYVSMWQRLRVLAELARRYYTFERTGQYNPNNTMFQIMIRHRLANDSAEEATGLIWTRNYDEIATTFNYDPLAQLLEYLLKRAAYYTAEVDLEGERYVEGQDIMSDFVVPGLVMTSEVEFNFFEGMDQMLAVQGIIKTKIRPKTNMMASKKWIQISDETRTNCFWVSLAICCGWKTNPSYLYNSGFRMKAGNHLKEAIVKFYNRLYNKTVKQGEVVYPSKELMIAAAQHCKVKIVLYNMMFEPFERFAGGEEEVHILVINQLHAAAMVERKELQKFAQAEPTKYRDFEPERIVGEVGRIKLKKKDSKGKFRVVHNTLVYQVDNGNFLIDGVEYNHPNKFGFDYRGQDKDKCFQYISFTEQDKNELIDKSKQKQAQHEHPKKRFVTGDIEAFQDEAKLFRPYAFGILFWLYGETKVKQFWGLDCLEQGFKFMHEHIKFYKDKAIYFHNGGKFDFYLILRTYLLHHDEYFKLNCEDGSFVESKGKIMQFEVIHQHTKKSIIKFKDSCLLFPDSLAKLTKDMKVKHQKLEGEIAHHQVTRENFMTFKEKGEKYLEHDVWGLYEALDKIFSDIYENNGIDMLRYPTASSYAINKFWIKYYDQEKYPLYKMKSELDRLIREGYFGGRNECGHIGIFPTRPRYYLDEDGCKCFDSEEDEELYQFIKTNYDEKGINYGKYYYYDVSSLYPFASSMLLPYHCPIVIEFQGIDFNALPMRYFGFFEIEVMNKFESEEQRKNFIPLHGYKASVGKDGKRLIFPIFNTWTRLVLFSEEIYFAQERKLPYIYKVYTVISFKAAEWFKPFMHDGYNNKAKAKDEGKSGMEKAYKLEINGAYGRLALGVEDKDSVRLYEEAVPSYLPDYIYQKLININNIGNYTAVRALRDLPSKDFNVAAAAAITSYSRMHFYKIRYAIESKGFKFIYGDTDSVITDFDMETDEAFMKEFCWDGKGKELGTLKNEADELLPKEVYAKWKKPGKSIYFNTLAVVGAKMYYISLTLPDGTEKVKTAFKGLSKRHYTLKLEDFMKMVDTKELELFKNAGEEQEQVVEVLDDKGEVLCIENLKGQVIQGKEEPSAKRRRIVYAAETPGQVNFKSGKQLLMSSDQDDSIKVMYKSMKFRLNYTKGVIEGDPKQQPVKVKPLTV